MTKLITKSTIENNLDFPKLIDQVRDYYVKLKEGTVTLSGCATNLETQSFIVMGQPVYPWKSEQAQPVATTAYLYMDYMNGEIKAVVGGADLVAYRTPAKSALAAKYLAPNKEKITLGLIGLGIQSVTHAKAFNETFNLENILVTSRTPDKWQHNIDAIADKTSITPQIKETSEVVNESDIIVLITSSKEPIVEFEQLHPGQLIIGTDHADTVGKSVALNTNKVFVDYRPTAENENATIKMLLDEGKVYDDLVTGDLLQLASNEIQGRESEDEIIFFQSLGVMCENLAAVEYYYGLDRVEYHEVDFES